MKFQNQLLFLTQIWIFLLLIINNISVRSSQEIELNTTTAGLIKLRSLHRTKRSAVLDKSRLWDYGIIPFEVEHKFFTRWQRILLKRAMQHWANFTCITFVERDVNEHPNYIVFTKKPCGCCSDIGNLRRGSQDVSIGYQCDKLGVIIHELGHTIGFYHEHVRPDRDEYVNLNENNIRFGSEELFHKKETDEVDTLGQPYDYFSIMHYNEEAFAENVSQSVLFPRKKINNKYPEIGQRVKLSEGDIIDTNILYKCPTCGRTLLNTNGIIQINSTNLPTAKQETCMWRIATKPGNKITFNINFMNIHKSNNCTSDYIIIYDGYWDKSPILGIYCGYKINNAPLVSTKNYMLVKYVKVNEENDKYGFEASYKVIKDPNYSEINKNLNISKNIVK